jgi:hypothetical protein
MDATTGPADVGSVITRTRKSGRGSLVLCSVAGIACFAAAGVYSSKDVRAQGNLQNYLRGAISCCTARQLAPFAHDPRAPETLIRMLDTPVDEPYWENTVLALGVLAPYREDLAEHFVEFAYTPDAFGATWGWSGNHVPVRNGGRVSVRISASDWNVVISEGLFAAKMRGLVACGNLLNHLSRADSKAAAPASLTTLREATDPAFWQTHVRWKSVPHFADDTERNCALAGEAVKALAFSGFPEAEAWLNHMRDVVNPRDPVLKESLEEALCIENPSCSKRY